MLLLKGCSGSVCSGVCVGGGGYLTNASCASPCRPHKGVPLYPSQTLIC